jgi:hypothetical protein
LSPAKINELFDTLRAAYARQFGFNPRHLTLAPWHVELEESRLAASLAGR